MGPFSRGDFFPKKMGLKELYWDKIHLRSTARIEWKETKSALYGPHLHCYKPVLTQSWKSTSEYLRLALEIVQIISWVVASGLRTQNIYDSI